MINMSEKSELWNVIPENNWWSEQEEKKDELAKEHQKSIDELTEKEKRNIRNALNLRSKTSRSDWRNGARDLYRQGKLTYEQAKKIIDMMKTY